MAALRGYRRILVGNTRKYVTPQGNVITRHEYDKRRAKRLGFDNYRQLEVTRKADTSWWQDWDAWRHRIESAGGRGVRQIGSPEMEAYAQVVERRAQIEHDSDDPELVAADGPLARLLTAVGFRQADDTWAVGETPKGERRG